MAQGSRFLWNELNTRNPDSARRFYESLAGWRFEAMAMEDGGTYWVATAGAERAGGLFTMSDPAFESVPDHWLAYLHVDDVDAGADRVVAEGGQVIQPPFSVPEVGRIAIVKDSGGAVLALMTPLLRA